jgi:hypothetical protein
MQGADCPSAFDFQLCLSGSDELEVGIGGINFTTPFDVSEVNRSIPNPGGEIFNVDVESITKASTPLSLRNSHDL